MNMSTLISRIKLKLGLNVIATPFEINDFIIQTLELETIPVFSLYAPLREVIHVNLRSLKELEKGSNYITVLLPNFRENQILNVEDVQYDDTNLIDSNSYGYTYPTHYNSIYQQLVLSNAGLSLLRGAMPSITYTYHHPNQLTIYNAYVSREVAISLAMQHDKSLASIKPTMEESFFDLALLDVKYNLYSNLKHYNQIQSAYGTIDLKIDDWQSAESDRKELISKWDDSYHLDGPQMVFR